VLDIKVQHVFGQRPTEFKETPELGTREESYEQGAGANVEWCSGQREQFVSPQTNHLSSFQLLRDHADRPWPFTGISAKFEIDAPNLTEEGGDSTPPLLLQDRQSCQPPKSPNHRVIFGIDDSVSKGDLQNFRQWLGGPFRFR
jgi:hypothetical protein